MRGRTGWIIGGVAGLIVVGVVVWWASREHEDERAQTEAEGAAEAAEDEAYAGWFGEDETDAREDTPMRGPEWPDRPGSGSGPGAGAPWGDGPMPERMRRRFEIVALGETPPSITPEQLVGVVREQRGELRGCVQRAGGWRALRDQMRAADAGRRGRPRATFDLDANGRIIDGTFSVEPPLPPQIGACVEQVFTGLTFPPPGPDGARIEMPIGGGPGRGRGRGRERAEGSEMGDWQGGREKQPPP